MAYRELRVKNIRFSRRAKRTRFRIKKVNLPRLSIFRSNQYVWVQVIDDANGKTLVSASSKGLSGGKTETAFQAGKALAQAALSKKVKHVVFDRGAYQYHGRVKAVADGAREGGLQF